MKYLAILFVILIFINFICASCSEGQIDVNTATEKELERLYGIGPVKVNAIIEAREFDSINELINVNGVGEITLAKIKEQGLACVSGEDNKTEEETKINLEKSEEKNITIRMENIIQKVNLELEPIKLSSDPKDIKTEDDEKLNTGSYAIYGLFGFCILLAFLFAFKKIRDKKYKNEFN